MTSSLDPPAVPSSAHGSCPDVWAARATDQPDLCAAAPSAPSKRGRARLIYARTISDDWRRSVTVQWRRHTFWQDRRERVARARRRRTLTSPRSRLRTRPPGPRPAEALFPDRGRWVCPGEAGLVRRGGHPAMLLRRGGWWNVPPGHLVSLEMRVQLDVRAGVRRVVRVGRRPRGSR